MTMSYRWWYNVVPYRVRVCTPCPASTWGAGGAIDAAATACTACPTLQPGSPAGATSASQMRGKTLRAACLRPALPCPAHSTCHEYGLSSDAQT